MTLINEKLINGVKAGRRRRKSRCRGRFGPEIDLEIGVEPGPSIEPGPVVDTDSASDHDPRSPITPSVPVHQPNHHQHTGHHAPGRAHDQGKGAVPSGDHATEQASGHQKQNGDACDKFFHFGLQIKGENTLKPPLAGRFEGAPVVAYAIGAGVDGAPNSKICLKARREGCLHPVNVQDSALDVDGVGLLRIQPWPVTNPAPA